MGVGGAGEKGVRTSTSTSRTPGMSDKSYTPTPAMRGALSGGGMKRSSMGGASGSERVVRKEVVVVSPPKASVGAGSGSQPIASKSCSCYFRG